MTNNSASAARTSSLRNRRATGRARHSRLASSMIDRMRAVRDKIDADEHDLAADAAKRLKGELLSHIRNRDAALHAFLVQRDPAHG